MLENRAASLVETDLTLRPWPEVAKRFNAKHKTHLTRSRVWQIGQEAIRKMRRAMLELNTKGETQ